MSMFDSLKSKLGIDPEGDAYLDDTEDEIFAGDPGAAAQNYAQAEAKQQHSNKVVNINATTQLQVVLVKPERFEDASAIADQLNAKRTVVLNLESTGKEVSRRLIDFCPAWRTPTTGRSSAWRPAPSSSRRTMSISWAT